ncbi:MAG: hypothetical protein WAU63_07390 [Methylovirgula sp.]|jgi:hypothetical protein
MIANRNYKPLAFLATALSALFLGVGLEGQSLAQSAQRSADVANAIAPLDSAAATARATHNGIWKAVVPPVKMKGAFDDHDPIGLAAGKQIPADCSINWTNPDTHKLYCFSSATSLVYFLNAPHTNIARATKGWLSGS